ncbi:MAG: rhamnan synthesis F family protein [Pseudomonadota bacterium]
MTVPTWKIRREAIRLGRQLRGIPEVWTDRLQRKNLDESVAEGLPLFEGSIEERKKIAIILVFQPHGLLPSCIEQCHWMVENGYAPLVVANHDLQQTDIERLRPVTWRSVIRPNFGYDFGGYRDALISLTQWGVSPDTIMILNDSVWLPVHPETNLLHRLETHPADIAGSIERVREEERFLESYCYRIKGDLLGQPAFQDFWVSLQLTSNKYYVIRRGERGFSRAMRNAGYSVGAVYDPPGMMGALREAEPEFLRKTLSYAAFLPIEKLREWRALCEAETTAEWRNRALSFIDSTLSMRQGYSTFPYAAAHFMNYPFLKKSKDRASTEWRAQFLKAVDAADIPAPPETILLELRQHVARDPDVS